MKNLFNIDKSFVTGEIADIDVDKLLVLQIDSKKSITGVQKKLSLVLKSNQRVTITNKNADYIIKPNTKEFPCIAEAEFLNMQLANLVGIKTPSYNLIKLKEGVSAYIIKRMDRVNGKKIHMEDFAQLSERGTEYKYNSSYEQCLKLIDKYSSAPQLDKVEFIYRLLFCYLTLNSDMHLKNFSLIENNGNYLSPAYDLLPVNLIYQSDKEEVALTLNGKKKHLVYKDFLSLSKYITNGEIIIPKLINKLISNKSDMINTINSSFLTDENKRKYIKILNYRIDSLLKNS